MTSPPDKPKPRLTPRAEVARQDRERREAAALRENLRRRKAQSRATESMNSPGSKNNG